MTEAEKKSMTGVEKRIIELLEQILKELRVQSDDLKTVAAGR